MTLDDLPPGCLFFLPVWLRVGVPVCLLFTDEQLCICLPAWLSHHVHLTKAIHLTEAKSLFQAKYISTAVVNGPPKEQITIFEEKKTCPNESSFSVL